jgi:hypothetical protein
MLHTDIVVCMLAPLPGLSGLALLGINNCIDRRPLSSLNSNFAHIAFT